MTLIEYASSIVDPRSNQGKKHSLEDIILLAIYAIIVGAVTWLDIQYICEEREEHLRKFLKLKNGIPSHDTFQRVFAKLAPTVLNNALTLWIESVLGSLKGKHIAIDGKTLRKSFDTANEKSTIHTLNAFVVDNLTVIRHEIGSKKDSEITLIPELLKGINIKESTITIDAIGCQKSIINEIVKKKANYLIALKGNQKNLHKEVKEYFEFAEKNKLDKETFSIHQTLDAAHGRIENRSYFCLDTKHYPLSNAECFKDIKTIIRVNRVREIQGKQSAEMSYYISNLECDAKKISEIVRGHWAVENSLHYVLDVVYKEDENRTRKDHSASNFSLLRKIALSLVNLHKDKKQGQKRAKLRAMLTPSYAEYLLFGKNINEKII